jgi:hypothetical protein
MVVLSRDPKAGCLRMASAAAIRTLPAESVDRSRDRSLVIPPRATLTDRAFDP